MRQVKTRRAKKRWIELVLITPRKFRRRKFPASGSARLSAAMIKILARRCSAVKPSALRDGLCSSRAGDIRAEADTTHGGADARAPKSSALLSSPYRKLEIRRQHANEGPIPSARAPPGTRYKRRCVAEARAGRDPSSAPLVSIPPPQQQRRSERLQRRRVWRTLNPGHS